MSEPLTATERPIAPANLTAFKDELTQRLPQQTSFDRFSRAMHATDASVYQILPIGVVTPESIEDICMVVHLCQKYGISITARGGGTSQAGQAIGHGISLDFSKRMNRLLEFNPEERLVWVEPGMVLDELNATLKPHGLQLPLDLSTSSRATIGGMIANNSAGTRSIIYGKTLDYVEALKVVLSNGEVIQIEPLDKESLASKVSQENREGTIYRTVKELGEMHQAEIEARYPNILRRVGGYNLDAFVPGSNVPESNIPGTNVPEDDTQPNQFNLAHMLVGSEGTLGLTVAAKLRVVPLPTHRILCVVQFEDLLEAMTATPVILMHNPSAVELMDRFMLGMTQGKLEFEPLRDFIVGDPGSVLLVEFFGHEKDALPERIDQLEADLQAREMGHHIHRAIGAEAQAKIWTLRKAALGLTMAETGDAKAISFVEDTAVAPEKLHDYIESFQQILAKYETSAGFYAHASVGLLHIRPVVDMKTALGVERFEAIANEVSDLVLEYGGALSGEHGDGLVRAPFQEKIFGPELYQAFCQIKAAFDPQNLFNPGKIVHAPALTSNLRFGPEYETPEVPTAFDFSDFGGVLRAAEQCSGVGACRKTLTGTMCPSYMATHNEKDSTRGRANALRLALTGQLEAAGLADEELRPVMELCLECKACKSECPTGVDMARLKSEFLHQYRQAHGTTFKDRLMSRMDWISKGGSWLAPLSNWMLSTPVASWLNEKGLGFDRRRSLPAFARRSFLSQWKQYQVTNESLANEPSPKQVSGNQTEVALFADTFNNYYEPEHLMSAASLIEILGGQVSVAPQVCCGRPLISKGFLEEAASQAAETAQALLPLAKKGIPILFCEPSCYSAVVDDHPKLLRGQQQVDAQTVASACHLVEEWAVQQPVQQSAVAIRPGPKKLLVHGHCHQKALVGVDAMVQLLSAIPDCEVTVLDSGCCGMAGSFGYEYYEISQKIGERRLLPAVREMGEEEVVVAPGFSCRQQIKHFTGTDAESITSLLAKLFM
ncbi:MAG: FAD-linked oxidase C-terminal domain-containing protein [Chloroflexota bacterium]